MSYRHHFFHDRAQVIPHPSNERSKLPLSAHFAARGECTLSCCCLGALPSYAFRKTFTKADKRIEISGSFARDSVDWKSICLAWRRGKGRTRKHKAESLKKRRILCIWKKSFKKKFFRKNWGFPIRRKVDYKSTK